MPYTDPIDPPEGGILKAADLLGQFCLIRVVGEHFYPATPAKPAVLDDDGNVIEKAVEAKKEQTVPECDVWLFDRAGFVDGTTATKPSATNVRIGWWKAVEQLNAHQAANPGGLMGCKPMQEPDSNARYLAKIGPNATEIAAKLSDEIDAAEAKREEYDDLGEEPF